MSISSIEDWKSVIATCPKCGSHNIKMDTACILLTYPVQHHFECQDCAYNWIGYQADEIPKINDWPSLTPESEAIKYGWVCPKCGRVYSPTVNMCYYCGGDNSLQAIEITYSSNFRADTKETRKDYSNYMENQIKKEK